MERLAARRVLFADGSVGPGAVTIADGRIAAITRLGGRDDLPDRTLSPGLVDLQVNGWAELDVAAIDGGGLDDLGRRLAARGTTSWCPTLISQPVAAYRRWFDEHPSPAPGEVGVHIEGPYLAASRAGAHPSRLLRRPDADWLDGLPARVRLVTLAPELAGADLAIARLVGRGVRVSLGHSAATFDEALAAAAAGASMVTHVFNAMNPLHHRDPGLAGAALSGRGLTPAVIADGVHVHPAVVHLVLCSGPAVLVSDSVAWDRPGVIVAGGAARLAGGATLAGSVISLAEAVARTVGQAGVPLATALVAATRAPAAILGLDDRGVLSPGRRADLVAFGPDLTVTGVWVGGVRQAGPTGPGAPDEPGGHR